MVRTYRKKPVEIQAIRYDELNHIHVAEFIGKDNIAQEAVGQFIYIRTLEGNMMAKPGDYIIRGIKGEFYPCQSDIFEASYDQL